MVLTKEEIRERIRIVDTWILNARTALFPAVVPENRMRYVVLMTLTGNQQANAQVNIEKLEEDGATYTMKFSNIPVAPAGLVNQPLNYDIEQPLIALQGGSNLYGRVTGTSLQGILHYWDDVV